MQTSTSPRNAVHGGKDRGSIYCDVLVGIHIASLLAMKFVPNDSPRSTLCRSRASCCKPLCPHCRRGTRKGFPVCNFKCWLHQDRNSFQHICRTLGCMQQDSKSRCNVNLHQEAVLQHAKPLIQMDTVNHVCQNSPSSRDVIDLSGLNYFWLQPTASLAAQVPPFTVTGLQSPSSGQKQVCLQINQNSLPPTLCDFSSHPVPEYSK